MELEVIKRRKWASEEPFLLVLADGRRIEVPERFAIAMGGPTVVVCARNGRVHRLAAAEIVGIEEQVASK